MKLSPKAIEEFKEVFFGEFGEQISDHEAQALGGSLISLFRTICRPVPKADRERILEEIRKELG